MSTTVAVREVRLYGRLAEQFGHLFELAVRTPAEAARALCAMLPGFERAFVGPDGLQRYTVLVGRGRHMRDISPEQRNDVLGSTEPIRIVPVIEGAKRGGWLQVIVGAVLIAADMLFFHTGALTKIGVAMVLGGVIQLLSPQRTGTNSSSDKSRIVSYAFSGPVNNVEQGPVPCVFGRAIVGSVVVSQGISSEELIVDTGDDTDPEPTSPERPPHQIDPDGYGPMVGGDDSLDDRA